MNFLIQIFYLFLLISFYFIFLLFQLADILFIFINIFLFYFFAFQLRVNFFSLVCPAAEDMERFPCPSPDRMGRYRCIDEHLLCDGFTDCPLEEDEDREQCMFYKMVRSFFG